MNKKCCFIIPYFGDFPNYFQLFLNSCSYNTDYNWLIFSDSRKIYRLPDNVEIIYLEFDELKKLISSKFEFYVSIDTPYKLCDYKPAYGYIFEDYIKDYAFWGHCDIDIIVGTLNDFITDDMLRSFDKIFCLGHMILYRNTYSNNRLFMSDLNGFLSFKKAFTSPNIDFFDEEGESTTNINRIFKYYGKRIFEKDLSYNPKIVPTKFVRTIYNPLTSQFDDEKYRRSICVWSKGHIIRYYIENNVLKQDKFPYMHLQSRDMKVDPSILDLNTYKIIPNKFSKLENEITDIQTFYKIKSIEWNMHRLRTIYKFKSKALKKWLNKFLK